MKTINEKTKDCFIKVLNKIKNIKRANLVGILLALVFVGTISGIGVNYFTKAYYEYNTSHTSEQISITSSLSGITAEIYRDANDIFTRSAYANPYDSRYMLVHIPEGTEITQDMANIVRDYPDASHTNSDGYYAGDVYPWFNTEILVRQSVSHVVFDKSSSIGGYLDYIFYNVDTSELYIDLAGDIYDFTGYLDTKEAVSMSHFSPRYQDPDLMLNYSKLDTSNCRDLSYFISNLVSGEMLTLNFDTSKVENFSHMFAVDDDQYLYANYINISSFDTSSATTLEDMFPYYGQIVFLDISGFDIKQNTMFSGYNDISYSYLIKIPKDVHANGSYQTKLCYNDDDNENNFYILNDDGMPLFYDGTNYSLDINDLNIATANIVGTNYLIDQNKTYQLKDGTTFVPVYMIAADSLDRCMIRPHSIFSDDPSNIYYNKPVKEVLIDFSPNYGRVISGEVSTEIKKEYLVESTKECISLNPTVKDEIGAFYKYLYQDPVDGKYIISIVLPAYNIDNRIYTFFALPMDSSYLFSSNMAANLERIHVNENTYIDFNIVKTAQGMFSGLTSLKENDLINIEFWPGNTIFCEDISMMFYQYQKDLYDEDLDMISNDATKELDLYFLRPSLLNGTIKNMYGTFAEAKCLESIKIFEKDREVIEDWYYYGKYNLQEIVEPNLTNMSCTFQSCHNLKKIEGLECIKIPNVENLSYMFEDCSRLYDFDVSNIYTDNATNMAGMFGFVNWYDEDDNIINLDLTHFNTENVTNMQSMFEGARIDILNISSFDIKDGTDTEDMFKDVKRIDFMFLPKNISGSTPIGINEYGSSSSPCKYFLLDENYEEIKNGGVSVIPTQIYGRNNTVQGKHPYVLGLKDTTSKVNREDDFVLTDYILSNHIFDNTQGSPYNIETVHNIYFVNYEDYQYYLEFGFSDGRLIMDSAKSVSMFGNMESSPLFASAFISDEDPNLYDIYICNSNDKYPMYYPPNSSYFFSYDKGDGTVIKNPIQNIECYGDDFIGTEIIQGDLLINASHMFEGAGMSSQTCSIDLRKLFQYYSDGSSFGPYEYLKTINIPYIEDMSYMFRDTRQIIGLKFLIGVDNIYFNQMIEPINNYENFRNTHFKFKYFDLLKEYVNLSHVKTVEGMFEDALLGSNLYNKDEAGSYNPEYFVNHSIIQKLLGCTPNCNNYSRMFRNVENLVNADVSSLVVDSNTDISQMFDGCENLKYVEARFNIDDFNFAKHGNFLSGIPCLDYLACPIISEYPDSNKMLLPEKMNGCKYTYDGDNYNDPVYEKIETLNYVPLGSIGINVLKSTGTSKLLQLINELGSYTDFMDYMTRCEYSTQLGELLIVGDYYEGLMNLPDLGLLSDSDFENYNNIVHDKFNEYTSFVYANDFVNYFIDKVKTNGTYDVVYTEDATGSQKDLQSSYIDFHDMYFNFKIQNHDDTSNDTFTLNYKDKITLEGTLSLDKDLRFYDEYQYLSDMTAAKSDLVYDESIGLTYSHSNNKHVLDIECTQDTFDDETVAVFYNLKGKEGVLDFNYSTETDSNLIIEVQTRDTYGASSHHIVVLDKSHPNGSLFIDKNDYEIDLFIELTSEESNWNIGDTLTLSISDSLELKNATMQYTNLGLLEDYGTHYTLSDDGSSFIIDVDTANDSSIYHLQYTALSDGVIPLDVTFDDLSNVWVEYTYDEYDGNYYYYSYKEYYSNIFTGDKIYLPCKEGSNHYIFQICSMGSSNYGHTTITIPKMVELNLHDHFINQDLINSDLSASTDYIVSQAGTHTIYAERVPTILRTMMGIIPPKGTLSSPITINANKLNLSTNTNIIVGNITSGSLVDGKYEPEVSVVYRNNKGELVPLTRSLDGVTGDYTVTYTNNTAVGTGTATITGINSCLGTLSQTFGVLGSAIATLPIDGDHSGDIVANFYDAGVDSDTGRHLVDLVIETINYNSNETVSWYGDNGLPWVGNGGKITVSDTDYYIVSASIKNTTYLCNNSGEMFSGCEELRSIDLTNAASSSGGLAVYYLYKFCFNCSKLESFTLGNTLDTSSLGECYNMFDGCTNLEYCDLSNLKHDSLIAIGNMFSNCNSLSTLLIPNDFIGPSITDLQSLFFHCGSLTSLDLSGCDFSNVAYMVSTFDGLESLTSLTLPEYDPLKPFNKIQNMANAFWGVKSLTSLDLSCFEFDNLQRLDGTFQNCTALTSIDFGDHFTTEDVIYINNVFNGCSSLDNLTIKAYDKTYTDFEKVINASGAFEGCSSLETFNIGDGIRFSSQLGSDNSGSTQSLFRLCSGLTSLDLGEHFNLTNSLSVANMFDGCTSLESLKFYGDNEYVDFSNASTMSSMFYDCESLETLDIGKGFKTTNKLNNIWGAFTNVSSLKKLDFGDQFNISSVNQDLGNYFTSMTGLEELDLGTFNYQASSSVAWLFNGLTNLTKLDLSGFSNANTNNTWGMFYNLSSLSEIDLSTVTFGSNRNVGQFMQKADNLTHIIFGDTLDDNIGDGNFSTSGDYVDTTIEFKEGTSEATMRKLANYNWEGDKRIVFNPSYTSSDVNYIVNKGGSQTLTVSPGDLKIIYNDDDLDTITYQWYFTPSTTNVEYSPIAGETNASITIDVDYDTVGYYKCIVTNGYLSKSLSNIYVRLPYKSLSDCTITIDNSSYNFTGNQIKPTVVVTDPDTGFTLEENVDYVVEYINNVEPGTNTGIVRVKQNDSLDNIFYSGSKDTTFSIIGNQDLIVKLDASTFVLNKVYDGQSAFKGGGGAISPEGEDTYKIHYNYKRFTTSTAPKNAGVYDAPLELKFSKGPLDEPDIPYESISGFNIRVYIGDTEITDDCTKSYDSTEGIFIYNYTYDDCVTITKKTLTYTAVAEDKAFDGTNVADIHFVIGEGQIVGTDEVSITPIKGTFSNIGPGTGITVTTDVTVPTLSGAQKDNYQIGAISNSMSADIGLINASFVTIDEIEPAPFNFYDEVVPTIVLRYDLDGDGDEEEIPSTEYDVVITPIQGSDAHPYEVGEDKAKATITFKDTSTSFTGNKEITFDIRKLILSVDLNYLLNVQLTRPQNVAAGFSANKVYDGTTQVIFNVINGIKIVNENIMVKVNVNDVDRNFGFIRITGDFKSKYAGETDITLYGSYPELDPDGENNHPFGDNIELDFRNAYYTGLISPKEITYDATVVSRSYEKDNVTAEVTISNVQGVIDGEDVTLETPIYGTFASEGPGTGISVTAPAPTILGDSDVTKNYFVNAPTSLTGDIGKVGIEDVTISDIPDQEYNFGNEIHPEVTLTYDGETIPSSQYTVAYSSSNSWTVGDDAGTVTITFKNTCDKFSGTIDKNFDIGKKVIDVSLRDIGDYFIEINAESPLASLIGVEKIYDGITKMYTMITELAGVRIDFIVHSMLYDIANDEIEYDYHNYQDDPNYLDLGIIYVTGDYKTKDAGETEITLSAIYPEDNNDPFLDSHLYIDTDLTDNHKYGDNIEFNYVNDDYEGLISPKEITYDAEVVSRSYEKDNVTAEVTISNVQGVITGEDVTLETPITGTFASEGPGTGISVTAPAPTILGDSDVTKNYFVNAPTSLTGDIDKVGIEDVTISDIPDQEYNFGNEIHPVVTLTYDGETIPSSQYTVAYSSSNSWTVGDDAGTVTITFNNTCDKFSGTIDKHFDIIQKTIDVSLSDEVNNFLADNSAMGADITKIYDGTTTMHYSRSMSLDSLPIQVTGDNDYRHNINLGYAIVTGDYVSSVAGTIAIKLHGDYPVLDPSDPSINNHLHGDNIVINFIDDDYTGLISPKELTYTSHVTDRVYEPGDTSCEVVIDSVIGVISGEDITLSSPLTGSYSNDTVGNNKAVTCPAPTIISPSGDYLTTNYTVSAPTDLTGNIIQITTGFSIGDIDSVTYDFGNALSPSVNVYLNGTTLLSLGTDYNLTYETDNNWRVGTNTSRAKVELIGKYSGTLTKDFEVVKKEIDVKLNEFTSSYNKDKVYDGDSEVIFTKDTPSYSEKYIDIVPVATNASGTNVTNLHTIRITGTYSSKDAENNKSITLSGEVITDGTTSPYSLDDITYVFNTDNLSETGSISKKELTYSVLAQDKNYDGNKDAIISITNYDSPVGVIDGEVVTLSETISGTFASIGPSNPDPIAVTTTNAPEILGDNDVIKNYFTNVTTELMSALIYKVNTDNVNCNIPDQVYNYGHALEPTITLLGKDGETIDPNYYTVSYSSTNNWTVEQNAAKVTVTFKDDSPLYQGTKEFNYNIIQRIIDVSLRDYVDSLTDPSISDFPPDLTFGVEKEYDGTTKVYFIKEKVYETVTFDQFCYTVFDSTASQEIGTIVITADYVSPNAGTTAIKIHGDYPSIDPYTSLDNHQFGNNIAINFIDDDYTGLIEQKEITYTATVSDRVYESGNTSCSITISDVEGVIDGEDITLDSPITGTYQNDNVENNKAVTCPVPTIISPSGSYLTTNYIVSAKTDLLGNILPITSDLTADDISDVTYNYGNELNPLVIVYHNSDLLELGTDYTVEYTTTNDWAVGTNTSKATITFQGIYSGTIEKEFSVVKRDVHIALDSYAEEMLTTYSDWNKKVYDGDTNAILVNTDHKFSLKENFLDEDGEPILDKYYYFDMTANFNTKDALETNITLSGVIDDTKPNDYPLENFNFIFDDSNKSFSGLISKKELTYTVSARDKTYDNTLKAIIDITNWNNPGGVIDGESVTLSQTIEGTFSNVGPSDDYITVTTTNMPSILGNSDVTKNYFVSLTTDTMKAHINPISDGFSMLDIPDQIYNYGHAIKPAVSVFLNGTQLTEGMDNDFTVEYTTTNDWCVGDGACEALVTLRGLYSGTLSKTFNVLRKDITINLDERLDALRALDPDIVLTKDFDGTNTVYFKESVTSLSDSYSDNYQDMTSAGTIFEYLISGTYNSSNANETDITLSGNVTVNTHGDNINVIFDTDHLAYDGLINKKSITFDLLSSELTGQKVYDKETLKITKNNSIDINSDTISYNLVSESSDVIAGTFDMNVTIDVSSNNNNLSDYDITFTLDNNPISSLTWDSDNDTCTFVITNGAEITKREIYYKATTNPRDYDGTTDITINLELDNPSNIITKDSIQDDVVLPSSVIGTFSSKDASDTSINITMPDVTLSGVDSQNYHVTPKTDLSEMINKKLITYTYSADKVFDGLTDAIVSITYQGGIVGTEVVTLSNNLTGDYYESGSTTNKTSAKGTHDVILEDGEKVELIGDASIINNYYVNPLTNITGTISDLIITDSQIQIQNIPDFEYTGYVIKPSDIVATFNGTPLVINEDYRLEFLDSSIDDYIGVGEHKLTVIGINDYSGSKLLTYNIIKKKLDISNIKIKDIDTLNILEKEYDESSSIKERYYDDTLNKYLNRDITLELLLDFGLDSANYLDQDVNIFDYASCSFTKLDTAYIGPDLNADTCDITFSNVKIKDDYQDRYEFISGITSPINKLDFDNHAKIIDSIIPEINSITFDRSIYGLNQSMTVTLELSEKIKDIDSFKYNDIVLKLYSKLDNLNSIEDLTLTSVDNSTDVSKLIFTKVLTIPSEVTYNGLNVSLDLSNGSQITDFGLNNLDIDLTKQVIKDVCDNITIDTNGIGVTIDAVEITDSTNTDITETNSFSIKYIIRFSTSMVDFTDTSKVSITNGTIESFNKESDNKTFYIVVSNSNEVGDNDIDGVIQTLSISKGDYHDSINNPNGPQEKSVTIKRRLTLEDNTTTETIDTDSNIIYKGKTVLDYIARANLVIQDTADIVINTIEDTTHLVVDVYAHNILDYAKSELERFTYLYKTKDHVAKEINLLKNNPDYTLVESILDILDTELKNLSLLNNVDTNAMNLFIDLVDTYYHDLVIDVIIKERDNDNIINGEYLESLFNILYNINDKVKVINDSSINYERRMISYQLLNNDERLLLDRYSPYKENILDVLNNYYGDSDNLIERYIGTNETISNITDNETIEVYGIRHNTKNMEDTFDITLNVNKITNKDELDNLDSLVSPKETNERLLSSYDVSLNKVNPSNGNVIDAITETDFNILVNVTLPYQYKDGLLKIYRKNDIDSVDNVPIENIVVNENDPDTLFDDTVSIFFYTNKFDNPYIITSDIKSVIINKVGDNSNKGNVTPYGVVPIEQDTLVIDISPDTNYLGEVKVDGENVSVVANTVTLKDLLAKDNNVIVDVSFKEKPKDDDKDDDDKKKSFTTSITVQYVNEHESYLNGYSDNTIRPNGSMTRAEFSKVLCQIVKNYDDKVDYTKYIDTNKYKDINKNSWYANYVGYMLKTGLMVGYKDNSFKPNSTIKRSEAMKVLANMFEVPKVTSSTRYDNELKGKWYSKYVKELIEGGIVKGYTDGMIKPQRDITRAEAVTMINRLINRQVNTKLKDNVVNNMVNKYKDLNNKGWYFNDIVEATLKHGEYEFHIK